MTNKFVAHPKRINDLQSRTQFDRTDRYRRLNVSVLTVCSVKIAIACDHAGFPYKAVVIDAIQKQGHEVLDLGTDSTEAVDFPDYAEAVGRAIVSCKAQRGIVLCGSGIGMSIAANKIDGIRAAVCHDSYSAQQGVEHNNMNVLAIGARVVHIEKVPDLVSAFLNARFSDEPRYRRRTLKIDALEGHQYQNPR